MEQEKGILENVDQAADQPDSNTEQARENALPKEINGPKGPEPTRYGDWEVNGRCSDF